MTVRAHTEPEHVEARRVAQATEHLPSRRRLPRLRDRGGRPAGGGDLATGTCTGSSSRRCARAKFDSRVGGRDRPFVAPEDVGAPPVDDGGDEPREERCRGGAAGERQREAPALCDCRRSLALETIDESRRPAPSGAATRISGFTGRSCSPHFLHPGVSCGRSPSPARLRARRDKVQLAKRSEHAARNDRSRPDGRQHGAPADARRATTASSTTARRRRSPRWSARARPAPRRSTSFVAQLAPPRVVWLMVPAAVVDASARRRSCRCSPPATSSSTAATPTTTTTSRAPRGSHAHGLHYVDVGTSGGVWGLERGYCLMIGGESRGRAAARPDLRDARPGRRRDARARRAARATGGTAEQGYLHCGPSGAGHFVKMVHNGIEYGLMAAYAEGLNILRHANVGDATHARPTPRPTPLARSRALPVRPRPRRRSPRSGGAAA